MCVFFFASSSVSSFCVLLLLFLLFFNKSKENSLRNHQHSADLKHLFELPFDRFSISNGSRKPKRNDWEKNHFENAQQLIIDSVRYDVVGLNENDQNEPKLNEWKMVSISLIYHSLGSFIDKPKSASICWLEMCLMFLTVATVAVSPDRIKSFVFLTSDAYHVSLTFTKTKVDIFHFDFRKKLSGSLKSKVKKQ